MDRVELNFWWETRDPSQADDARRLSQFVTGLPGFDPIYQSWLDSPKTTAETVSVPLGEAEARGLLIDNMTRADDGRGPLPELGSHIWGGHAGPPPYDFRESSYADTLCRLGSYGLPEGTRSNHIFMRLSALRPSTGRPWRASELRPLMRFSLEIWNPPEMCAMLPFNTRDLPSIPNPLRPVHRRPLRPRIGWITYLPANLASRAKYPADMEVETLEDGAALVTLCEEPFEKGDAEGLARLHALEAALRPIQS
jgi:hypothetical protein